MATTPISEENLFGTSTEVNPKTPDNLKVQDLAARWHHALMGLQADSAPFAGMVRAYLCAEGVVACP